MATEDNYLSINKASWNKRTEVHVVSEFYDIVGFIAGNNSLNEIESALLGDVSGKKILHLQCHFGQDSLSLARLGAVVTGIDLSDKAIDEARLLAKKTGLNARFICCDIYDLPMLLDEHFDIVFTTYGTIGWLPDLVKWGAVIDRFLKPKGKLVFAEFHPVVWMFDDHFEKVAYNYFKENAIIETSEGSYADRNSQVQHESVTWNHSLSEVFSALLANGMQIEQFEEFDYSPYNCFEHTVAIEPGKFRIEHLDNKIPMVYSLVARKQ